MSNQPHPISDFRRRHSAAPWVIAVLLGVIATLLWSRPHGDGLPAALAQDRGMAGARGIYAFTGQIDSNRHGLFMLDIDQGTIWCYELDNVGGTRKLRLVAARSWIYDRYLQDFNCAPPDFRMVQELVAEQRTRPPDEARPPVDDKPDPGERLEP